MSKKEIHYQGLAELSVIVEDTSALSPDYFKVTKLPTELTAGLNTFKFKGQPQLFPENAAVYVEILDANGEPIYYEVNLDLESEEQPAIVSIYVTQDTTPGNGTIIICAGANQTAEGDILDPSEINVRWQVPIYIDISKRNEDAIIFNALPIVTLFSSTGSHKELTYYNFSSTYSSSIKEQTQLDGFITSGDDYIKYYNNNDTPVIILPTTLSQTSYNNGAPIYGFLSHIENATISFTYSRIISSTPTRPSNIVQSTVSASISTYSGSLIAYLSEPLSYALSNSNDRFYPKFLDLNRMNVSYVMPAEPDAYGYIFSKATENTYNIVTASFVNLQPLTGEIAKIRTYYKSSGINEYIILNETDITSYAEEFGFNTSSLQTIFSLPTSHRNEKIDFKFEFVNPAGNASKQVIEVRDKTLTGGNTYIGGDDNLMTGSLYVAGSTGTGVHISGKGSAAMIRSIGYNGFFRATSTGPGGFVIYSGSVQPLLSASESYSGVGIELVANSSSYFRYTTSGSGALDIRTDTFFLGNPSSSYIAGSPAGIIISSSNFSLNQSGSISMTGNVNANTGIFGNVNVVGTVITGSVISNLFGGPPFTSKNAYLIEPWFTGSNQVFTGSVLNRPVSESIMNYGGINFLSTGLFNWYTIVNETYVPFEGGITGSRYSTLSQIDGFSTSLPKYFDKWGSIIGSYKIPEYSMVQSGSWTNTLDNVIFKISPEDVCSLQSDVIEIPNSLLSVDNLEPLELQIAARFTSPGIDTGWIENSDNKFTVEVFNIGGTVVVESTQYQTDADEWLTFNIPISPGLFTHPVVTSGFPSKPIKSYNKFYIKLTWSSIADPIYGAFGYPTNIRISELRIVRLAKSLGLKTSAIQFDSTFFSSTPISTEHFGSINPTQDNHSDLGSYDVNSYSGFNHHIDQKRWRTIYALNLYATDTVKVRNLLFATGSVVQITGSLNMGENPVGGESGGYFNVINPPTSSNDYSSLTFYSVSDTDGDGFGKATMFANAEEGVTLQASSYDNTNPSTLTVTEADLYTYNSTTRLNAASSFKVNSPNVQVTGSLNISGSVNLNGNRLFNYGQFSSTETQSGSADTAYSMKFNTTDFTSGITVANNGSGLPTRITAANTGLYNIQFSAQLGNTANSAIDFDIWFAYTGSNIANSNTQVHVNKTVGELGRAVAAWNFMTPIRANDYIEIMWSCDEATGQLQALGTQTVPTRPAVPSVIATVTQVV